MKWVFLLTAFLSFIPGIAQQEVEHLLMYYMPYDNNLGVFADTILSQLENSSEKVSVTVMLDRPGPGGRRGSGGP